MMNIPKQMRDIFIVREPQNWFVCPDYSQLEMRIVADLAQASRMISWFRQGLSVHMKNAEAVYGKAISKDDIRYKMIKNVGYGLNYGAGAERLWRTMLPEFPDMKLSYVRNVIKEYYKVHPELKTYHRYLLQRANIEHFVEEPISGRREYFHDGKPEPSKVLNFPIQGSAGTIINKAIMALDKELHDGVDYLN